MVELADASDSKSDEGNFMRVRPPLWAPEINLQYNMANWLNGLGTGLQNRVHWFNSSIRLQKNAKIILVVHTVH